MKIKTITCHDVYNAGASLQSYALMTYLKNQRHDVEIIDYKPDYLSHHYDLWYISNPKYRNIILKYPYLLAKLPNRLKELFSQRKKDYDYFTKNYLNLTNRYNSIDELKKNPPIADVYLAGSDQIWNIMFNNGYDPAFYLQFGDKNIVKASYAASFAVEEQDYKYDSNIKEWLSEFDYIGVRESSALEILNGYNVKGQQVMDPVFLLTKEEWNGLVKPIKEDKYIFVTDFDKNEIMMKLAKELANKYNAKVISLVPLGYEDEVYKDDQGPLGFLSLIKNACCVLSNSFHATAFSIIFHTDLYVVNRIDKINTRMRDLLEMFGLSDRLISVKQDIDKSNEINWNDVDLKLKDKRNQSIEYLNKVIETADKRGEA